MASCSSLPLTAHATQNTTETPRCSAMRERTCGRSTGHLRDTAKIGGVRMA